MDFVVHLRSNHMSLECATSQRINPAPPPQHVNPPPPWNVALRHCSCFKVQNTLHHSSQKYRCPRLQHPGVVTEPPSPRKMQTYRNSYGTGPSDQKGPNSGRESSTSSWPPAAVPNFSSQLTSQGFNLLQIFDNSGYELSVGLPLTSMTYLDLHA